MGYSYDTGICIFMFVSYYPIVCLHRISLIRLKPQHIYLLGLFSNIYTSNEGFWMFERSGYPWVVTLRPWPRHRAYVLSPAVRILRTTANLPHLLGSFCHLAYTMCCGTEHPDTPREPFPQRCVR
jgi:hypothetical protein